MGPTDDQLSQRSYSWLVENGFKILKRISEVNDSSVTESYLKEMSKS